MVSRSGQKQIRTLSMLLHVQSQMLNEKEALVVSPMD